MGFWARLAGVRRKSSKARRRGEGLSGGEGLQPRPESSLYKSRWDPRLAKMRRKQDFRPAPAHDVEAARRGGSTRRGWRRGGAFALAWVYGGTQPLGGYAHEPGEAQALQRSGLYTIARPRSATRPWRGSGWRSRRREEVRRGVLGRRRPRAHSWTAVGSCEEPQRLCLYPRARALRQPRSKTVSARRADMTAPGVWVTRAKGPTFSQRAQAQRRTGTRWASKRARMHAGVTATAAAETATTIRRLGRLSHKGNKEPENGRGCTCGDDGDGTRKNFPSLARWPASPAVCVVARWRSR
jgi:hypothetical protein